MVKLNMSGDYYVGCIADLISSDNADQATVSPANNLFNKSKTYGTKKITNVTYEEASVSKKKKSRTRLSEDVTEPISSVKKKKRKRNEEVEEYEVATETKNSLGGSDEVVPKKKKKHKNTILSGENEFQNDGSVKRKKKKRADDKRHTEEEHSIVEKTSPHEKGSKRSPSKKDWMSNDQTQSYVKNSGGARTTKERNFSFQENKDDDDEQEESTPTFSNVPKKKDEELEARTVFIGNVPVSCDKKKMKKLVSQFGSIETIRFRSAPVSNPAYSKRVSFITKDFKADRRSVNCYVRYKSIDDAYRALSFNGTTIDGLTVRVDIAGGKKSYDYSRAVFIGNVPFEAEEEELREEFCSCGEIEDVRIVRDRVTCAGKGFAYINFASSDGAQLAMELDGKPLHGRTLRVKPCVKKVKNKPGEHYGRTKGYKASGAMGKHGKRPRSTDKASKAPFKKHRTQFKGGRKFRDGKKQKQSRTTVPSYAGEQTAEVKTTKKEKKPFMTKEERLKRKYAKMLTG